MNDSILSNKQAAYLTFAASYGGIVFFHAEVISIARRSAWIAEQLSGVLLIPLAFWVIQLAKSQANQTIFEIIEKGAGKLLGRFFSLISTLIAIILSSLMITLFANLIKSFVLHASPLWFIMLLTIITVYIITESGIEAQARVNLIFTIVLIVVFFGGLGVGFIKQFDITNIFPIFDQTFQAFLKGTYLSAAGFSEVILFMFVLISYMQKPGKVYKSIMIGLVFAIIVVPGMVVFTITGLLGVEDASKVSYAGLNAALRINLGNFIQGMEVFILITYELVAVMKLCSNFQCAWKTASHIFGLKLPRTILVIICLCTYVLALIINSFNRAYEYYLFTSQYIVLPFILLVLLLTTLLKFIGKERGAAKN